MKRWIVLAALLLSAGVHAAEASGESGVYDNSADDDGWGIKEWLFGDQPPPKPPEQAFTKPALSELKRWVPYSVNFESRANDFYIALDSISVGPDDIVRYAFAVVPKRGNVRNLSFEGLDCRTKQYRVYAYGSEDGKSWQDGSQGWKRMVKNQRNAYQGELSAVFCNGGFPEKATTIVDELWDAKKQPSDCPGCRNN
ncbi:CNP1-like family protein [Chitinolyticbacter meiyuanensis]|uniref:CNP1-like family protein n=1 Tax=Chitinolyticbacter meiyuanensis TaxID=682798 RepID=UPI0011E58E73|nr:CNP1-like family protein [Chitinolyticbacter meiyuanensis]